MKTHYRHNLSVSLSFGLLLFPLGCGRLPLTTPTSVAFDPANTSPITRLDAPAHLADRAMLEELAKTYYQQHDDLVDMLVIWGTHEFAPGHAFYLPVKNDVPGIGYQHVGPEFFDDSATFGSDRLQGVIWMGTAWMNNPEATGPRSVLGILAQETAHRWGTTIHFQSPGMKSPASDLLGTPFHWSFFLDTGGSPLGGNHWSELENHIFRAAPTGEVTFSPIDLYLMGLLPADQVPPLRLLVNVRSSDETVPGGFSAWGDRVTNPLEVRAEVLDVPIEQIIEAEGLRDPLVGFSASEIRQAWIVVDSESLAVTEEEMAKLFRLQQAWPEAFRRMTGDRATVITAVEPLRATSGAPPTLRISGR